MTKSEIIELLELVDDEEDVDINRLIREREEAINDFIEELEWRQHESGFYSFQDKVTMWRFER